MSSVVSGCEVCCCREGVKFTAANRKAAAATPSFIAIRGRSAFLPSSHPQLSFFPYFPKTTLSFHFTSQSIDFLLSYARFFLVDIWAHWTHQQDGDNVEMVGIPTATPSMRLQLTSDSQIGSTSTAYGQLAARSSPATRASLTVHLSSSAWTK